MAYITDITHFLNDKGAIPKLPAPAIKMINFLSAIVSAVSSDIESPIIETDIKCCSKGEDLGVCHGKIEAWCNSDHAIEWYCDSCSENGVISNWEKSIWDNRTDTYH